MVNTPQTNTKDTPAKVTMKVKTLAFLGGVIGAIAATFAPLAQVIPLTCNGASPCFGGNGVATPQVEGVVSGSFDIRAFILRIISFMLDFVLLLAVLMIIIAGLYLIISNGDEGNKEKARKIVIYTIAGIILILFSRAIVVYVNNFFT